MGELRLGPYRETPRSGRVLSLGRPSSAPSRGWSGAKVTLLFFRRGLGTPFESQWSSWLGVWTESSFRAGIRRGSPTCGGLPPESGSEPAAQGFGF